jgi:hypothetical protein
MHKRVKKIVLHRETLRSLNREGLMGAAGGTEWTAYYTCHTCDNTCFETCYCRSGSCDFSVCQTGC